MANPRNANPTRKVEFRIPVPTHARLEMLAKVGHYGGTAGEVARFLMNRELDDLTRAGVLKPE